MRRFGIGLAALAVSACSGGSGVIPPTSTPPAARPPVATPQPSREPFRTPSVMQDRGLNGVIGAQARALTARFGQPRIDLVEGDARKLQFMGQTCVLDIYLYPLEAGRQPVATHVESRLRANGGEIDRARCIAEVERR